VVDQKDKGTRQKNRGKEKPRTRKEAIGSELRLENDRGERNVYRGKTPDGKKRSKFK